MSNPFAKLVNPHSTPDPNKITLKEFERYNSLEQQRFTNIFKIQKKSSLYFGGLFLLSLGAVLLADRKAKKSLFGADYQGGEYLDIKTTRNEADLAYNRQFQRRQLLTETKTGNVSKVSTKLLNDLGVDTPRVGAHHLPKKVPHEKYY